MKHHRLERGIDSTWTRAYEDGDAQPGRLYAGEDGVVRFLSFQQTQAMKDQGEPGQQGLVLEDALLPERGAA